MTTTSKMTCIEIAKPGDPDVLVPATRPKPKADFGEVVIKVAAVGVNGPDLMQRKGLYPPPKGASDLLGLEVAGTIAEIGDGVSNWTVGDPICGLTNGGGYAEFVAVNASHCLPIPAGLNVINAASLPETYFTIWSNIFMTARLLPDEVYLVHGGAGGVGHLAIQMARHFGATVFATGGSDEQAALIEKLGATYIDYRSEKVADYVAKHTDGAGFDVIYDSVGGGNLQNSFEAAKLCGQVATTVSLIETDLSPVHFKGLSLHVVFMLIPMIHDYKRENHVAILRAIADIVDAGALTPVLDSEVFTLDQVSDAHARLASGKAMGKIVIDVAS